jgi:hypothetical protein
VEGVVAGALLLLATLDRVADHVGQRLHEVHVLGPELAVLGRLHSEDAEGAVGGSDHHREAAGHLEQGAGALEAGLGVPVVDDHRGPGGQGVAGLRAGPGGQRLALGRWILGLGGHDDEGLLLGDDLDDPGHVDVEHAGEDPQPLAQKLVDVLAAERALTEARDLLLLTRLQAADALAHAQGVGGRGKLFAPPGLVASLRGADPRGADEPEGDEGGVEGLVAGAQRDGEEGGHV